MRARIANKIVEIPDERVRGGVRRGEPKGERTLAVDPLYKSVPSPYKSKWEATYADKLALEVKFGVIKGWAHEHITLKLAAGKYHRPDFTVWHLDGSIEMAQVKGHHKNLRASLTGLKWAAQLNPWFRFTLNRREGNGWDSRTVEI